VRARPRIGAAKDRTARTGREVRAGRAAGLMKCPKCGSEQPDGNAVCDLCGIVFAKYAPHPPSSGEARPVAFTVRRPPTLRGTLGKWLLPVPVSTPRWALLGRSALWLGLCAWGARLMLASIESNAVGGSFLHLVNLPFHEAGHVVCIPLGDFVHSLGGTLGQLAMPLVCCGALLLRTRDGFGASVAFWWFGENFLDIAPYIDDARAGQLPLLGGNTGETSPYGFHDWGYLLSESGLLSRDHEIARASHEIGCLVMIAALVWGALALLRTRRESELV